MSVKSLVEAALQHARSTAGATKAANAPEADLIKLANQLAEANEYLATMAVDDGSVEGAIRRDVVERYFKGADAEGIPGPAESVALTGTQVAAPQSGAKKLLPIGKASGDMPAESGAPTGVQATLDQATAAMADKKADGSPMTLLDLIIAKQADTQGIPGPGQSVSGQNENSNIDIVRSAEGIVNATKRDAKLPTRARLRQLFANAGDTDASRAAAAAAFPQATAKGGLKEAAAELQKAAEDADRETYPISRALTSTALPTIASGLSGGAGGALAGLAHGTPRGAVVGGLLGAGIGAIGGYGGARLARATTARAARGRAATGYPGLGASESHMLQAIRKADKQASLVDYANLYELAATGQLGEEVQAFTNFVESM